MLSCSICGVGAYGEKTDELEEEISRALLSALLGKVEFATNEENRVTKISFEG